MSLEFYDTDNVPSTTMLNLASAGVAVTSATFTVASDTSMWFYGVTNSCLADAGFTSVLDVCLGNPAQCSLTVDGPTIYSPSPTTPTVTLTGPTGTTGLSMSVWVNVPQQSSNWRQYIIDTGGGKYV